MNFKKNKPYRIVEVQNDNVFSHYEIQQKNFLGKWKSVTKTIFYPPVWHEEVLKFRFKSDITEWVDKQNKPNKITRTVVE